VISRKAMVLCATVRAVRVNVRFVGRVCRTVEGARQLL
jgi:hypothetical protein